MSVEGEQRVARTALIADDSVAVRRLVSAQLASDGYDVSEAADGYAALEQIERAPPDLLIVDDVLPGLSGVEIVHELRARGPIGPARIAFLVEYPSGFRRAALAGVPESSVIRKPFDLDELAQQIRAIVSDT